MRPNDEPNIRKQVKLDLDNSEASDSDLSVEELPDLLNGELFANNNFAVGLQLPNIQNPENQHLNININDNDVNDYKVGDNDNELIPNLQEITQALHDDLRDVDNEAILYDFIQELRNINQEIPSVEYPELINLDNYPGLLETILSSVRNGGENLIINENNLTVNGTNLILQGVLNGLNAYPPQFQELRSLQISSNVSDGDNVAMDQNSMNLLSNIVLHPNNQVTNLDIRSNNIDPNNLNILLRNIAENPDLTANLREICFSLNFIDQNSVELLNAIFANNEHILIEGEYSIPEGLELGNLANNQRFEIATDLLEADLLEVREFEDFSTDRSTPSNNLSPSNSSSLDSSNSSRFEF